MLVLPISQFAGGLPSPILWLEGDDATFSGTDLATWPARLGPTPTIAVFGNPQQGPLQNGHRGVQFRQAETDQLRFGTVHASVSDYTFQLVYDNTKGESPSLERQYLFRATTVQDSNELAIEHNTHGGGAGGWEIAYYDGVAGGDPDFGGVGRHGFRRTGYLGSSMLVPTNTRRRVVTWVLGQAGCALYEDGVLLGTSPYYVRRTLVQAVFSGAWSSDGTDPQTFVDGNLFSMKVWNVALSEADALSEQAAAMTYFGLSDYTLPADVQDIFGGSLVALYDFSDLSNVDYDSNRVLVGFRNVLGDNTYDAIRNGAGTPYSKHRSYAMNGRGAWYHRGADTGRLRADALASHFSGLPATHRHMLMVGRHSTEAGDGTVSNAGYWMSAGNSLDNDGKESLIMRAGNASGNEARALRQPDSGSGRQALGGVDPGTTTHAVIASQSDETTDVASVEMDGTKVDSAAINIASVTMDRFTFGAHTGATEVLSGLYGFAGLFAVVVGTITTQQRADFRAAAQAQLGAV